MFYNQIFRELTRSHVAVQLASVFETTQKGRNLIKAESDKTSS